MKLKTKAIIYKYTGVFLAYKEQADFVAKKEFWTELQKAHESPHGDMGLRQLYGLQIGSWQAHNGFVG